ncbi:MAG: DUF1659 domain-containing protein [Candidatus Caldatribacterium sp.]|nr:DUF1659 domain-containing protein [Candidatus Caldatribacterium sp.]
MPPVVVVEQPNRLRIRLEVGQYENGRPIIRSLSYQVKETAAHQDVYDVALAIAGLVAYPVHDFILTENKLLTE